MKKKEEGEAGNGDYSNQDADSVCMFSQMISFKKTGRID